MDGTFACPECGAEVRLEGIAPGRNVRCGWCSSWVEVPYFPRAGVPRRSRSQGPPSWLRWWRLCPLWAKTCVLVLSVLVVVAVAGRLVVSRVRSAEWDAVARLANNAAGLEREGRLDAALVEMEAALSLGRKIQPWPTEFDDLRAKRDALALREATARLDRLESAGPTDPARAVGEALTLQTRAVRDPAVTPLEARVHAVLEVHRKRWAEADFQEARSALAGREAQRAMDRLERLFRTAAELGPVDRRALQGQATTLADEIIARQGVIIEPVRGLFTLGSPESHGAALRPLLDPILRGKGYVSRPAKPVWDTLWNDRAPYGIAIEVTELLGDPYFQSPNRTSDIDARIAFRTREPASTLWEERFRGRTQIPVPGVPAYQASRMAVSARRSPEFERVLYDDARKVLLERIRAHLQNLPTLPSFPDTPGS